MKFFLLGFLFFSFFYLQAREPLASSRYEALSGIQKVKDIKKDSLSIQDEKKNERLEKIPKNFLAENLHYLPLGIRILDLSMGDGNNAVFLARKGYKVTAIEEKEELYMKARILAKEYGVRFESIFDSPKQHIFPPDTFDAIICFNPLDKSMVEKIKKSLRLGGRIIFETNIYSTKVKARFFPSYYEMLTELFKGMRVIKYEEPLDPKNHRAGIILQKER